MAFSSPRRHATTRRPLRTRSPFALSIEHLETRTVPSTFSVVNLLDAGSGSLRQALLDANGGAGGPPVGAVHSGQHTPVVPVGGGSVFGSDPKHLKGTKSKAVKPVAKTLAKHKAIKAVSLAKAKATAVHDAALKALAEAKNARLHK